jgi:hypothetical protein
LCYTIKTVIYSLFVSYIPIKYLRGFPGLIAASSSVRFSTSNTLILLDLSISNNSPRVTTLFLDCTRRKNGILPADDTVDSPYKGRLRYHLSLIVNLRITKLLSCENLQ